MCVKQQEVKKKQTQFWQQTRTQKLQNRKALLRNYGVWEKKVCVVGDVVAEGETERISATAPVVQNVTSQDTATRDEVAHLLLWNWDA